MLWICRHLCKNNFKLFWAVDGTVVPQVVEQDVMLVGFNMCLGKNLTNILIFDQNTDWKKTPYSLTYLQIFCYSPVLYGLCSKRPKHETAKIDVLEPQ